MHGSCSRCALPATNDKTSRALLLSVGQTKERLLPTDTEKAGEWLLSIQLDGLTLLFRNETLIAYSAYSYFVTYFSRRSCNLETSSRNPDRAPFTGQVIIITWLLPSSRVPTATFSSLLRCTISALLYYSNSHLSPNESIHGLTPFKDSSPCISNSPGGRVESCSPVYYRDPLIAHYVIEEQ